MLEVSFLYHGLLQLVVAPILGHEGLQPHFYLSTVLYFCLIFALHLHFGIGYRFSSLMHVLYLCVIFIFPEVNRVESLLECKTFYLRLCPLLPT